MLIGIDLGTTNSLASYYCDGKIYLIQNRFGEYLTPSVVAVEESGEIIVGKRAKEYAILHPEAAAAVFKRYMGTEKVFHLRNHDLKPEELSALILKSLKEDAEEVLQTTVDEAVISVPAYFNDNQRKATRLAGQLAGLKVDRIISEPTAAAITYGLYEKKESTRFLVFDLGGGTFDVSILELYDQILEVRAVAGDNFLGGEDFTNVIMDDILAKNQLHSETLTKKSRGRLWYEAEEMKQQLSEKTVVKKNFKLETETDVHELEYELSAVSFEKMTTSLMERIKEPLQKSMKDAHLRLSDIDVVVLVGGATRMPLIRDFIRRTLKKFPDTSLNPDEVVCMGAALQGAIKERKEEIKEVILTDVCGFTMGTEIVKPNMHGGYDNGIFSPIIERNTVIPVSCTKQYVALDEQQESIRVMVYQGESRRVENNLLLGFFDVELPQDQKGCESVDITYTYDINGLLEVEVKILSTGEIYRKVFQGRYNHMTEEEIAVRMKELEKFKMGPRGEEKNKMLLLRAERAYEESLGEERVYIEDAIQAFEYALDSRDKTDIFNARKHLIEIINERQLF